MSIPCTVLEDLRLQRAELKRGMNRIKKDLRLCASCQEQCLGYKEIKADIEQAITQTLDELTCPRKI
jgi:hypothetical protein